MTQAMTHASANDTTPLKVLRVDSSPKSDSSVTRGLADRLIETLQDRAGGIRVTRRDTNDLPYLDEVWAGATFTDPAERSAEQNQALAVSDTLVSELQEADVVVIGAPMYNFGVTATLKTWIDQITRARVTFQYTENGPQGLLEGKKVIVVTASGGTPIGSAMDFATPYLKHVLGFVGLTDVTLVEAGQGLSDAEVEAKTRDALANLSE